MYNDGDTLKTACGSPCYAAPEMIAGNVTMAWPQIYGVVVLFCTQWPVDIFHLRTLIHLSCIKRFWIAIIWYQDLYPSLQKNSLRKSSILIQSKDLPSLTSETMSGTARSSLSKWKVSLSVKIEFLSLKSSSARSKTASIPQESVQIVTLHKL